MPPMADAFELYDSLVATIWPLVDSRLKRNLPVEPFFTTNFPGNGCSPWLGKWSPSPHVDGPRVNNPPLAHHAEHVVVGDGGVDVGRHDLDPIAHADGVFRARRERHVLVAAEPDLAAIVGDRG